MKLKLTPTEGGQIAYSLPGGRHLFDMPAIDENATNSIPVAFFHLAADSLVTYLESAEPVLRDFGLSEYGKEAKMKPIRAEVVDKLVRAAETIEGNDVYLDKLEAQLAGFPKVEPTHAAVAVEDREIRDWWARQPLADRAAVLNKVQQQPQDNERLMVALMRSPVPVVADRELQVIRDAWAKMQREANPKEALTISDGRAWTEWSRRGLGHVVGSALSIASVDRATLLRHAVQQKLMQAAKFLQAGPVEIERVRQQLERAAA